MRVCVLGLGQVGFPTAKYIKEKGIEVCGYDINTSVVERVKTNVNAIANWQDVPVVDVFVICVSTFLNNNTPDLSPIFDACEKIAEKIKDREFHDKLPLVSIESTVIPGTCRKVYDKIFYKKVRLVHVPHRYWSGDPIKYGVKQKRVLGAIDDKSLKLGLRFYKDMLGIPVHPVSSIEVAELSKISENAYRYVQIAFAEELRMICEQLGLNFDELRSACNTKWNIEILEAREGIGGHCLPKDTAYLASLSKYNVLLNSAMEVDRLYRQWLSSSNNVKNLSYKKY